MKRYLILMTAVLTTLLGCVAYPTTRVYFEPNPADGAPVATSGCGYHTTKKDSLERAVGDVMINVQPEYVKGENLKVTVVVKNEFSYIALDSEQISVEGITGSKTLYPIDVATMLQLPSKSMPYYSQWYVLSYPVTVNDVDKFNLTIPVENTALPTLKSNLLSFGFKKIEKEDFYYNSINC
ncbi:hypothetical protein MD588_15750 [Photobacterium sp. SDRW27]|uniref:hypothetical protein n=1 Tax=Photobacterium obscurum TaxID=2829490 RepID=UPI002244BF2A|nr:hypothetical protein [Photobacterium obscurum]MCW8330263.1 hypothetical protein [Photobacterium obscurum]